MDEYLAKELTPLKLDVLLCLYEMEQGEGTVTNIARVLGVDKYTVTRTIQRLKKTGLVNDGGGRLASLTDYGNSSAAKYRDRLDMAEKFLISQNVPPEDAKRDATSIAISFSDYTMNAFQNMSERIKAKEVFANKVHFDGDKFCKSIKSGKYMVPFVIYREKMSSGYNISMANNGFEHPCELCVKNGKGVVNLKIIGMEQSMPGSSVKLTGRLKTLKYYDGSDYKEAGRARDMAFFPVEFMSFLNIGSEQIIQGSLPMRFSCTVGDQIMPESTAIFTLFFS